MGTTTEEIVEYAQHSNESQEPVERNGARSGDDEKSEFQPDQTALLANGEQKREPSPAAATPYREGEHQMKGIYAEVNPIGPANATGAAKRAASVASHQHGDALTGTARTSRVTPGVDQHTDLAIANDTRVAGDREVLGDKSHAPDGEGVINEEANDIRDQLVESDDLGANVVIPEPVDLEVPPYTDRVPVMEYDEVDGRTSSVGPRSLSDIQDDKEEAYEEFVAAVEGEPADREDLEDYDEVVRDTVETEEEYLAEQHALDTAGSPNEEVGDPRDPLGDAMAGVNVDEQPGLLKPPSEGGVEAVAPGEEPEIEGSSAYIDESEHGPEDVEVDYSKMNKTELMEHARAKDIKGRTNMDEKQLRRALKKS